jgi:transporter family protein
MRSWLWLPLALLSAVFAALVAVFAKVGLEKVDTTVATAARAAVMFVVLLAVVAATGKLGGLQAVQGKALLFVVLAGLAGAASWLFYFWALRVGDASKVAPIDRLSLVFVVLLAALFLGEKVGMKTGLGAALMTAGAVLIALP